MEQSEVERNNGLFLPRSGDDYHTTYACTSTISKLKTAWRQRDIVMLNGVDSMIVPCWRLPTRPGRVPNKLTRCFYWLEMAGVSPFHDSYLGIEHYSPITDLESTHLFIDVPTLLLTYVCTSTDQPFSLPFPLSWDWLCYWTITRLHTPTPMISLLNMLNITDRWGEQVGGKRRITKTPSPSWLHKSRIATFANK